MENPAVFSDLFIIVPILIALLLFVVIRLSSLFALLGALLVRVGGIILFLFFVYMLLRSMPYV